MIEYSLPIQQAKAQNQAIVALESTIITHGMPYPQNLDLARQLEQIVTQQGAVPATIAIIDGIIKIGLNDSELEMLAKKGLKANKLSTRDLPIAISQKRTGSTTVAATIFCAAKAGIAVFATGGIGGVHRTTDNYEGAKLTSIDISHDLDQLACTRMIVVSAGAKAILDLKATLEYLETRGVLVVGFKTDDFPAFYSSKSGIKLSTVVNSSMEIAKLYEIQTELSLNKSILVANPVSKVAEVSREEIEPYINQALEDAKNESIQGKELTPFLLSKLAKLTNSRSVSCNIELVKNNVNLAVQIAKYL